MCAIGKGFMVRGKDAIGRLTGVSEHNFAEEIRRDMDLPPRVIINDLTLREGRQLDGLVATPEECVHIARKLEEIGVPMIQIRAGGQHYEIMKAIGKANLKMQIEALSIAHQQIPPFNIQSAKQDIDLCRECNVGICQALALSDDLIRGVNELLKEKKTRSLDDLKKEQIELAVESVQYARKQKTPFNVNLQDFMRCGWSYMEEMCRELDRAGVGVITVDDIAGPALPSVYKYGVRRAKKAAPKATFGIHVHNDFGLGLPGVLGALEGGCTVLDCGINGYGERAGHADLATLVVILEFLYGYDTGIRLDKLVETSTLVADIYRQTIPKSAPIVGENAFSHCSDWHWQFSNYPWVLSALAPEVVGNHSRPIFGSYTGPFGVKMKAKDLGLNIPDKDIRTVITALMEEMRWRRRPLSDIEFRDVVTNSLKKNGQKS
jgi:isopropylmalate/homocitrate/citramalate synthase